MMEPVGWPQPVSSAGKWPHSCLAYGAPWAPLDPLLGSFTRVQVDRWSSGQHVGCLWQLRNKWKLSACNSRQDLNLSLSRHHSCKLNAQPQLPLHLCIYFEPMYCRYWHINEIAPSTFKYLLLRKQERRNNNWPAYCTCITYVVEGDLSLFCCCCCW